MQKDENNTIDKEKNDDFDQRQSDAVCFKKSPSYVSWHEFDSKAFCSHPVVHRMEEGVVHSHKVVRYHRDEICACGCY